MVKILFSVRCISYLVSLTLVSLTLVSLTLDTEGNVSMRFFNGMKLLLLSHTGKASFHLKLGNDGCYASVKPRKEVLTKEYLFNRWLTVKQLLGFWQNPNCAVLLAAY